MTLTTRGSSKRMLLSTALSDLSLPAEHPNRIISLWSVVIIFWLNGEFLFQKTWNYKLKHITIATATLLMRLSWGDKLFSFFFFFQGLQKQVSVFCHCHDLSMYLFENVVHKDTLRKTSSGTKTQQTNRKYQSRVDY